jgi:inorganic pyrophosphatase/exopolyphosphatase
MSTTLLNNIFFNKGTNNVKYFSGLFLVIIPPDTEFLLADTCKSRHVSALSPTTEIAYKREEESLLIFFCKFCVKFHEKPDK